MQDIPDDAMFIRLVKDLIDKEVPTAVDELERLLNRNRIFVDRTQGIGVITKQDAIGWGLTGPMARASGVLRDLRKDSPYLCFKDNWDGQGAKAVKFKVPIATGGDVYSRFLVRVEEIKQSRDIILQLIDNLPTGPINAFDDSKLHLPSKEQVYGSIEGLIQHFEIIMSNRGWEAPVGEVYAANETANGELGYYIVADGGPRAWRAHTRGPSFLNYQTFSKMTEGHMLSDVVAILGSINVIAAELDR
jgi:NADH-quinone oxidoreductase subunit D